MLTFLMGLLAGLIIGFGLAACCQCEIERNYLKNRFAKIDGVYCLLTPINKEED